MARPLLTEVVLKVGEEGKQNAMRGKTKCNEREKEMMEEEGKKKGKMKGKK
jgi:hypothetical protein